MCVYEVDHDNPRYSIAYTVINANKRKLYTFLYFIIPMAYRSFCVIESLFISTIEKCLWITVANYTFMQFSSTSNKAIRN